MQEDNSVADDYAKNALDEVRCATCERLGQFLPVRIAVGFANGGQGFAAPAELTAGLPTLPDSLIYILRRLDTGYLYCYSPAWKTTHFNDQGIRAYQVNELGYLTAIDKDQMQVGFKEKNYTCFQAQKTSKGQSISNAFLLDCVVRQEESSRVHIAYSRHQWSIDTCNIMAKDVSKRTQVMPSFDVKNGADFVISKNKYTAVLENYTDVTPAVVTIPWQDDLAKNMQMAPFQPPAYFTAEDDPVFDTFDIVKNEKGEKSIQWHGKDMPYKVSEDKRIIVLQDPVGITIDLLEIANYLAANIRTGEEERLYQSAMNIVKLQSWVKAKIHAEEYSKLRSSYALTKSVQRMAQSDEFKNIMQHASDLSNLDANKYEKDYEAATQKMDSLTREELENFHDFKLEDVQRLTQTIEKEFNSEWKSATGFFRTSASLAESVKEHNMLQWLQQQKQKIEQYTANVINPILDGYLLWLKSDALLSYMDHFFDHKTAHSAASFLSISTRIISNADTMEKCSQYFIQLFNEENYSNRKNYLLRSMTFDSHQVQQDLLGLSSSFVQSSQAPTFGFAFTQVFDENTLNKTQILNDRSANIAKTIQAQVEILSEQIGGSMARVFHGRINQSPNSVKTISMKSFETFSGKVISRVEVSGKLTDVIDGIIKRSNIDFDAAGSRQQAKNAKNAVKVNLYKGLMENFNSDVELKKVQGLRTKVNLVTLVDFEGMSKINGNMSPAEINQKFNQGLIHTADGFPSQVGAIEESAKLGPFNRQKINLLQRANTGKNFGVFSFALQSIALMDAGRGVMTSGFNSQTGVVFIGMIVSALGGVADVLDRQLKMRMGLLSSSVEIEIAQKITKYTARYALYAGALILAGVELKKAYGALGKDHYVLAGLYAGNAFLIVLSTHAFIEGTAIWALGLRASYWGIILVIGMMVISYGISSAERSALRAFLENSAWGVKPLGWTQEVEQQKFKDVYEGA